jgi:hypothetical protein
MVITRCSGNKCIMRTFFTKKIKTRIVSSSSENGFTLADLMIGACLTVLVAAGGGTAVASMVDSSTTANARSERRVEMNRALDFVTTEVNRAESLVQNPASVTLPSTFTAKYASISDEIETSTVSPVLMLKLPGSSENVIYFTATPKSGTWKGPKVLYRWGPEFSSNGTYVNSATPSGWKTLALLDRLDSFSAPVSGQSAQLVPTGRIQKLMGRSENYAVSMNTGTKKNDVATASFTPTEGATASAGTAVSTVPLLTETNGEVVVNKQSTMEVKFLGGDITCGSGGGAIPTSASVQLTGGTTVNSGTVSSTSTFTQTVKPNTTLVVTGTAQGNSGSVNGAYDSGYWETYTEKEWQQTGVKPNGTPKYGWVNVQKQRWVSTGTKYSSDCRTYSFTADSKSNQTTQVLTLLNGDTVPAFTPMGGQRNIDTFLQPYIDSSTGKVKIADNQVIYLYELGTTDSKSSAYDMQDLVVLATITPTTSTSTTTNTTTTTTTGTPTTTGSTSGGSTNKGCNNGLGNGSENCTPGNARPNDEIVRDAAGNIVCMPRPGNPCTKASKSNP